jgi:hypothetical protein
MATGGDFSTSWWKRTEALQREAKSYVGTQVWRDGCLSTVNRAYVLNGKVNLVMTSSGVQGEQYGTPDNVQRVERKATDDTC